MTLEALQTFQKLPLSQEHLNQCSYSDFSAPPCGWKSISRVECNLKGCCYSYRYSYCYYPKNFNSQNDLIAEKRFPELFTSSPGSCLKDQILPCNYRTYNSFFNIPASTCPSSCCYVARQQVIRQACPYNYIAYPGLSDLSNSAQACCNAFSCYQRSIRTPTIHQWGEWSSFGECVGDCGKMGTKTRSRICPKDIFFAPCEGSAIETASCEPECPCQWSTWSSSSCSISCSSTSQRYGSKFFRRVCMPESECPGKCPGPSVKTESCFAPVCPNQFSVSPWGAWSICDSNCVQTRERSCPLQTDNQYCNQFNLIETRRCPQCNVPQPRNMIWTLWTPWTPCVDGVMSRRRKCVNQLNLNEEVSNEVCKKLYKSEASDISRCSIPEINVQIFD